MREELDGVLCCDVLVQKPPIVVSGSFVVAVVICSVRQTALLDILRDLVLSSEVHLPLGKALVASGQGVISLPRGVSAAALLVPEVSFDKYFLQVEF